MRAAMSPAGRQCAGALLLALAFLVCGSLQTGHAADLGIGTTIFINALNRGIVDSGLQDAGGEPFALGRPETWENEDGSRTARIYVENILYVSYAYDPATRRLLRADVVSVSHALQGRSEREQKILSFFLGAFADIFARSRAEAEELAEFQNTCIGELGKKIVESQGRGFELGVEHQADAADYRFFAFRKYRIEQIGLGVSARMPE